jgi:hypothetical protein
LRPNPRLVKSHDHSIVQAAMATRTSTLIGGGG